ncbi:hypothetical protein HDU85_000813 [Gaertneriomyces sp. JEL0708]|nr:hypothetical protein HDU85_000813 [Gaertneriomyces sp. JEL0708]
MVSSVCTQTLVRTYNVQSKVESLVAHGEHLYILAQNMMTRWNLTDGTFERSYSVPQLDDYTRAGPSQHLRSLNRGFFAPEMHVIDDLVVAISCALVQWHVDSPHGDPTFVLKPREPYTCDFWYVVNGDGGRVNSIDTVDLPIEIKINNLATGVELHTLRLPQWADDIATTGVGLTSMGDGRDLFIPHIPPYGRSGSYIQQWRIAVDERDYKSVVTSQRNYTCTKGAPFLLHRSETRLCIGCLDWEHQETEITVNVWDVTSGKMLKEYILGCDAKDSHIFQASNEHLYCLMDNRVTVTNLVHGEIERSYLCDMDVELANTWVYGSNMFVKDKTEVLQYSLESTPTVENVDGHALLMQQP